MKNQSLSRAARESGRFFGAATRIDYVASESSFRDVLLRECGAITPEIHLKWDSIEPARASYNFRPVDDLVDFASANGKRVRGHTLIWDQSTPEWARREMDTDRDWAIVAGHFKRILSRYQDRIADWDVVNEPIDTQGGVNGLRATTFHRVFGPQYIERALEEARAHAPEARLIINDYGFDYENDVDDARRKALLVLLGRLKRAGIPLDGVGIQAHLDLSKGELRRSTVSDFLAAITALGLDITITELDVKEADTRASLVTRDRRVADHTRRYLDIVLAQAAVRGVVTWGVSDKYSWLSDGVQDGRDTSETEVNRGLPFDESLARKQMYWAIHDSFSKAARHVTE